MQAETDCEIIAITAQNFFERDPNLVSLRRYHRICIDCLARLRVAEQKDIEETAKIRAHQESVEINASLNSLALFGNETKLCHSQIISTEIIYFTYVFTT